MGTVETVIEDGWEKKHAGLQVDCWAVQAEAEGTALVEYAKKNQILIYSFYY